MAKNTDLTEQLQLTEAINKSVQTMNASVEKMNSSFNQQIQIVEKLAKVISDLNENLSKNINTENIKKIGEEAENAADTSSELNDTLEKVGDIVEGAFKSKILVGVGALAGLKQGFRNVMALSKAFLGFLAGAASGVGRFALSVLTFPLKMFAALVEEAAGMGGGNELARELEELRKAMGDLKGPGTTAVLEATNSLKGFSDTGLNAFRIFGTLAERLAHVREVAVTMGATFGVLKQEFIDNGGALLAFQKGLGISTEEMKGLGDRAITIGKPFAKVMLDMTKQTLALGKAFDIDQKLIGKDMSKALQNVKHFGALTVKEIATASVYARKLGVELEKITGTLDAFETFDAAAENVSKLSQTFGVQLDTYDLMNAQNPAEQIDALRKSFRAANVDSSTFTRQQLKMLQMTTGLDEATAKQVFSLNNYGVSLDDVKKKSEGAEKKQMTQAEAMSKLADSIERMVKDGGQLQGSFFKQFITGFITGIKTSKEFMKIMLEIRKSLYATFHAGFDLGRAFVKSFDGVTDVMSSLSEFFSKFGSLAQSISKVAKEFVKGGITFEGMMNQLKGLFDNFFTENSPSFNKMLGGFRKIFNRLSKIASEGMIWMSKKIAEGFQAIADFISNPTKFKQQAAGGVAGGVGFLAEILLPLAKAVADSAKIIWPSFKKLMSVVFKKLKDYFTSSEFLNAATPTLISLAAVLFGPKLGQAALGYLTSIIGETIFSGAGIETIKKVLSTGMGRVFAGLSGAALAVGASISVGKAIKELKGQISSEFSDADKTIAAGATGLIDALTLGLLPEGFKVVIANTIAKLSDSIFESLSKTFGAPFSSSLKQLFADQLDFIGSIGNVISALFAEDEDAFSEAVINLGKALISFIKSSFNFMLIQLPLKIVEWSARLAGTIWRAIKNALAKGIDKFGEATIDSLVKQFNFLLSIFSTDIGKLFDDTVDNISNMFKGLSSTAKDAAINIANDFKAGFKSIIDFLNNPMETTRKKTVEIIKDLTDAWNKFDLFESVAKASRAIQSLTGPSELDSSLKKGIKRDFSGYTKLAMQEQKQEEVFSKDNKSAYEVSRSIGEIQALEKTLKDKSLDLKKLTDGVREKLKDVNFDLGLTDEKAAQLSKASESAERLSTLFGSIDNAFSIMSAVPKNIQKVVGDIKAGALKPAMEAVSAMVNLANEMDTTLNSGIKIETPVKLAAFAKSVGLGANAKYTVTNKDVVINLHVKIDMNVDDVERIMIMRKKSIIRDQLNFLTQNPGEKAGGQGSPIPETREAGYISSLTKSPT